MKQIAYKGPRDSQEIQVGDQILVVDRSDFGKGGNITWVEVPNELAESLSEEWSVRDSGKKKAGDE